METMWVDGRPELRWHSAPARIGAASSSVLLEVPRGCALPRHADSAEETVVVLSGTAEISLGDGAERVDAGGVALIPTDAPHQVSNAGDGALRFVAVYASADVVTTYEAVVQPPGERRQPVA
jgi:quercetin dioxygenase-like cupin family protein